MDNSQDLTDDQAAALGLGFLCCCMLVLLTVIVVVAVVLWHRKKSAPKDMMGQVSELSGPLHLSVMAVALDAAARAAIVPQLEIAFASANPALMRAELVRRVCSILQTFEHRWIAFGYGEKDIEDLGSAEQSYRRALDDFRARATFASDDFGTHVVLTLVIATRGHLQGVAQLNNLTQIRQVLAQRAQLDAQVLLGAEIVWSPNAGSMTEAAWAQRFPEMVRIATA